MTVAFSQKQHGCRFTHDVTVSQHNHFLTGNSYACPLHQLQYPLRAGYICWQSMLLPTFVWKLSTSFLGLIRLITSVSSSGRKRTKMPWIWIGVQTVDGASSSPDDGPRQFVFLRVDADFVAGFFFWRIYTGSRIIPTRTTASPGLRPWPYAHHF